MASWKILVPEDLLVTCSCNSSGVAGYPILMSVAVHVCHAVQVESCADLLSSVKKVVLAVDADGPGVLLADELSRRIGREKCWRVTWPTGAAHHAMLPKMTCILCLHLLSVRPWLA